MLQVLRVQHLRAVNGFTLSGLANEQSSDLQGSVATCSRRGRFAPLSRVALTGKEFAILELMVLRNGSIISKEAFLNHLYGGMDEPELKIIDVFICKLRKKLALAGAEDVIGTIWGRGYVVREPTAADSMPVTSAANRTDLHALQPAG